MIQREFDENGNMLFEYEYSATEQTLKYVSKFLYDSQGNQIFDGWYDEEGNLQIVRENEYDQHGELVLSYSDTSPDDPEGSEAVLYTYENQYDENGNLVRTISYQMGCCRISGSMKLKRYLSSLAVTQIWNCLNRRWRSQWKFPLPPVKWMWIRTSFPGRMTLLWPRQRVV